MVGVHTQDLVASKVKIATNFLQLNCLQGFAWVQLHEKSNYQARAPALEVR
jgi:hypothetical protein